MNINLSVDYASPGFWGGLLSGAFLFRYALQVLFRKALPTGLASFSMWTILDLLLLINTFRTGQPIWLPLGWTLGAGSLSMALFVRGEWHWTKKETVVASAVVLAAVISIFCSGPTSLYASVVAMTAAGIPVLLDNWKRPVSATYTIWLVTVISCVLTLLGSDWSFDGTFLAWSSLVFNTIMLIIVLRKPKNVAIVAAT